MEWNRWLVIGAGVLAFSILVLILRVCKKKKNRSIIGNKKKHPTGFYKYHEATETVLKHSYGDRSKRSRKKNPDLKSVATFEFKGDLKATDRFDLSKLVDEIILNKEKLSEVVIRVESPGGTVAEYGHVYSEVARIPESGLKLTACVDSVAASGGYLAVIPATQILASPFAIVGSIGVASFVPNFRKFLEKHEIAPRTFTSGDYKRTVTLTDDASPEEVENFKSHLELIHDQFKGALKRHRSQIDLSRVATGEHWLAEKAIELNLGLVDGLKTSSQYLLELNEKQDLVEFKISSKQSGVLKLIKRLFQ